MKTYFLTYYCVVTIKQEINIFTLVSVWLFFWLITTLSSKHRRATTVYERRGYILVSDRLSVCWGRIHHGRVSSSDHLQTYTATAERELRRRAQGRLLSVTLTLVFILTSTKEIKFKFIPTQTSGSCLDEFPIEVGDHGITLLCCVHPNGGEIPQKPWLINSHTNNLKHRVVLWAMTWIAFTFQGPDLDKKGTWTVEYFFYNSAPQTVHCWVWTRRRAMLTPRLLSVKITFTPARYYKRTASSVNTEASSGTCLYM